MLRLLDHLVAGGMTPADAKRALASGKVIEAEFDAIVRPEKMLSPNA